LHHELSPLRGKYFSFFHQFIFFSFSFKRKCSKLKSPAGKPRPISLKA
jgi:hypothetical protein